MNYHQVIGIDTLKIKQMSFGYRVQDGYYINSTDREKINAVLDFLKKQQFVKQNTSLSSNELCNQLLYRISLYAPGEVRPYVNITVAAYDSKSITVNNVSYRLSQNAPSELKSLFEKLQKK